MLILSVDTSTRAGSVALISDRQVVAVVDDAQEAPYAARLFRDLAVLQAQAKFSLRDVDLFAVAMGPGSFTGLRVGLSAVKAWAEVYEKSIAGISGLEAIAVQAQSDAPFVAACMDARRRALFGAIYRRDQSNRSRLERVGSEVIVSVEEFCALMKEHCGSQPVVLASPSPELLALCERCWAGQAGVYREAVSPVLAPSIGVLGFEKAERGEVVCALDLDANYVRRSDAEVNKDS